MFVPLNPVIETDRLKLRLVAQEDLPALLAVNGNDAVTRYLPYESWRGLEDGEAWLGRAQARLAACEAWQFVMEHREAGQVIGSCLLFRCDAPSGRAEIGYALAQEYWGKGLMYEAMSAFVAYTFTQLGLRRLEAEIDPRNEASAKLLLRLGFVCEGLQRQRWDLKGEVTDSGLYGLLRGEWSEQEAPSCNWLITRTAAPAETKQT